MLGNVRKVKLISWFLTPCLEWKGMRCYRRAVCITSRKCGNTPLPAALLLNRRGSTGRLDWISVKNNFSNKKKIKSKQEGKRIRALRRVRNGKEQSRNVERCIKKMASPPLHVTKCFALSAANICSSPQVHKMGGGWVCSTSRTPRAG